MSKNLATIKVLDKIIFFFIILFLGSLTNSIFVNQLGYYGALIFILARYAYSRKNPFFKTGLELAFVLFIVAEILATIFAQNQPQSFTNLLKRVLLIPTFYTIAVVAEDVKKVKIIFFTYLGFALASCLIYLYIAYDYLIYNQFVLKGSGPSVFQYPITASELISFTTVFMFAFLINEKGNWKEKLFYLFAFGLSSLALISTFKRTGWIGTAAGLFAILVVKKQWKIIGAGFALLLVVVFLEQNESKIFEYQLTDDGYELVNTIEAEGNVKSISYEDESIISSEYDEGLIVYKDNKTISRLDFSGAVRELFRWNDSLYIVNLEDTRYILLKKNKNSFNIIDEFMSPGLTWPSFVYNNFFYANDKDSGLTVFRDPFNLQDTVRYKSFNNCRVMEADSIRFYTYSEVNGIKILSLKNGLPDSLIFQSNPFGADTTVNFIDDKIIISSNTNTGIYTYSKNKLQEIVKTNELTSIQTMKNFNDKILIVNKMGRLHITERDSLNVLRLLNTIDLGFIPNSYLIADNKVFIQYLKESRFLSIFDPHKASNAGRFALWRAGWEMFKDYPVFGIGDSDLSYFFKQYKRPFDKDIQGHLHNNYIHILATLGLFGFLVLIYLFTKIFISTLKTYKKVKEINFISSYSLGVIGVFVSFLFAGLTEWNFGDHEIITMLWFVLGLNAAVFQISADTNDK